MIRIANSQLSTASNIARQQADEFAGRVPRPEGLVQRLPLTVTLPMGLSLLCGYSIWLGAGSYEMSVCETPVAAGDVVLPPRSKEVEVPGRSRRGLEWSALRRQRA